MVAGEVWNIWFPINKNLWTSSFVLFSGGFALVFLAVLYWMLEIKRWRGVWTIPILVFRSECDRGVCGRFVGVRPRLHFHRQTRRRNHVELARCGADQAGVTGSQPTERIVDLFFGRGDILLDSAVVALAQAHFSEGLNPQQSTGNILTRTDYSYIAANQRMQEIHNAQTTGGTAFVLCPRTDRRTRRRWRGAIAETRKLLLAISAQEARLDRISCRESIKSVQTCIFRYCIWRMVKIFSIPPPHLFPACIGAWAKPPTP